MTNYNQKYELIELLLIRRLLLYLTIYHTADSIQTYRQKFKVPIKSSFPSQFYGLLALLCTEIIIWNKSYTTYRYLLDISLMLLILYANPNQMSKLLIRTTLISINFQLRPYELIIRIKIYCYLRKMTELAVDHLL